MNKIMKINNKQPVGGKRKTLFRKLIHLDMKGIEFQTKIKLFQHQIKPIKIFK